MPPAVVAGKDYDCPVGGFCLIQRGHDAAERFINALYHGGVVGAFLSIQRFVAIFSGYLFFGLDGYMNGIVGQV